MPRATAWPASSPTAWTSRRFTPPRREAIEHARSGKGPTLLETLTYRYYGHGASDHRPYRTREEEQEWWLRCPVASYRAILLAEKAVTEDELAVMEQSVKKEVEQGLAFASSSPDPDPNDAMMYVYTEES